MPRAFVRLHCQVTLHSKLCQIVEQEVANQSHAYAPWYSRLTSRELIETL